jgi:hypothetical protein
MSKFLFEYTVEQMKAGYGIETYQPNQSIAKWLESLGHHKRETYPEWCAVSKVPRRESAEGETEREAVEAVINKLI